jgi:hypothetical protein
MTNASNVAAIGALIYHHPKLSPLLVEHLEDNNGQVLPHLLMGDVMRWIVENLESDLQQCRSVLVWLDEAYESGNDEVRGLIVLSGVENIPDPGQPGSEIRGALSERLRARDPWLK